MKPAGVEDTGLVVVPSERGCEAMKVTLDKIANLVTIGTCVILCAVLLPRYWAPRADTAAPHLPTGGVAPSIPGISYDTADLTIVVAIRSNCRYCAESMPSLRNVERQVAGTKSGRARFVVVGVEDLRVLGRYLEGNGLRTAARVVVPMSSPFVRATPVVVAVDRDGVIRGAWLGRFDDGMATEVMRFLP